MDEKFLEQASAFQEHQCSDVLNSIQRAMHGHGQPDCEDCGEMIPAARRDAMPSAIRCIDCQSTFDIKKGFHR